MSINIFCIQCLLNFFLSFSVLGASRVFSLLVLVLIRFLIRFFDSFFDGLGIDGE